jgi:DNA helicase-2/ATP-dependent DNA helicase PcrA
MSVKRAKTHFRHREMTAQLNSTQAEAVNWLNGPLLVLAGAGSGKTRVITFRIAKLIQSGVDAKRILGVTFTNKAALEMQQRLRHILAKPRAGHFTNSSIERPTISTFHSHCVRILRQHIGHLGYPGNFAIYDRGDQESLAREVLREMSIRDKSLPPGQLLHWIGVWKNRCISPQQAIADADDDHGHLAAIGFDRYQRLLRRRGAVDFDDLLLLTERLFREHPVCRDCEAARFDHVLVDEYQDTNPSQYRIIQALARDHNNLCVVGDDDQSIYGWRGAEVEHILRFRDDWPNAKTLRLEQNYRSTASILQFANNLIRFNLKRHDKILRPVRPGGEAPQIIQCPDENREAVETVRSIQRRLRTPGREPRDFAVLFRTNELSQPFETELRKANLPYVVIGGMSFFDRKEVKDVLAYLKLAAGQCDDVSVLRVINNPPRGIGKKSIDQLRDYSVQHKIDLWKIVSGDAVMPELGSAARRGLAALASAVRTAQPNRMHSLADQLRHLIHSIELRADIENRYDDRAERDSRWRSVEQIVNALSEYERSTADPSLNDFLDRVMLGDQDAEDEKDKQLKKNAIALMTMHSAKGLEFPEVFIAGMEEGIIPHHRSLEDGEHSVEEERRLCYVAVTRAQERLTLSMSLSRMKWGKPRNSFPSRFLYELTGKADHQNYERS